MNPQPQKRSSKLEIIILLFCFIGVAALGYGFFTQKQKVQEASGPTPLVEKAVETESAPAMPAIKTKVRHKPESIAKEPTPALEQIKEENKPIVQRSVAQESSVKISVKQTVETLPPKITTTTLPIPTTTVSTTTTVYTTSTTTTLPKPTTTTSTTTTTIPTTTTTVKKPKVSAPVLAPVAPIARESVESVQPVTFESSESVAIPQAPTESEALKKIPTALMKPEDFKRHDSEFWLWAGIGENYQYHQQSIPTLSGTAKFQNIQGPTLYFAAGTQGDNFGAEFTHKETPGQMQAPSGATIVNGNFIWKTLSAEILYKLDDSNFRLRAGAQYHILPFIAYNPTTLVLNVKSNSLMFANVGFDHIFPISKKLRGEWLMRYQHPIMSGTSSGDTFNVKPIFAFDGSVGTVYKTSENLRLGLYWYGQYHQYKFDYSGSSTFSGEQILFYSNAELRIGLEF